jgi:hypothetical protein
MSQNKKLGDFVTAGLTFIVVALGCAAFMESCDTYKNYSTNLELAKKNSKLLLPHRR